VGHAFERKPRETCVLKTENLTVFDSRHRAASSHTIDVPRRRVRACRNCRKGADFRSGRLPSGECRIELGGFRPIRLKTPPFSAPGAIMFTYFPQAGASIFKNAVFLMLDGKSKP
jgi:hypothetical protein